GQPRPRPAPRRPQGSNLAPEPSRSPPRPLRGGCPRRSRCRRRASAVGRSWPWASGGSGMMYPKTSGARLSSIRQAAKGVVVHDVDAVDRVYADDAPILEPAQHARNGLERQPEIVGDIGTLHRKVDDIVGILTFEQIAQEARYLVIGAEAAKEHQMRLHAGEAPEGDTEQLLRKAHRIGGAKHANAGAVDALGIEFVLTARLQAEHISSVAETRDLATAVGGHLADADGSKFDEIQRTGFITLCVNGGVDRIEGHGTRLALGEQSADVGVL